MKPPFSQLKAPKLATSQLASSFSNQAQCLSACGVENEGSASATAKSRDWCFLPSHHLLCCHSVPSHCTALHCRKAFSSPAPAPSATVVTTYPLRASLSEADFASSSLGVLELLSSGFDFSPSFSVPLLSSSSLGGSPTFDSSEKH